MTSKNYLYNSIKENIRRNFYLVILLSIGFLAVLPISAMMNMESSKYVSYMGEVSLDPVEKAFYSIIGAENELLMTLVIVAGFFMGIAGFFYLYSQERTDFYHSLPLRREHLFFISFSSGAVIFCLPYLCSLLLTYLVGMAYGAVTPEALKSMCVALCGNVLYFLVFYGITILAILLTGNLFMGTLGFLGLLFYAPLVEQVYQSMNSHFFDTLAMFADGSSLELYFSPVLAYIALPMRSDTGEILLWIAYAGVSAALLFGVNVWVYKIRASESCHKAIAFPKLQPVIKFFCVVPMSLLLGLFFISSMGEDRFFWMAAGTLVGAVLLCGIFEFLYTMDIRKCIKPGISTGLVLAAVILLLGGYETDILGVDTYLPKKDKIQAMSVYFGSINGYFSYPNNAHSMAVDTESSFLKICEMEHFDEVYELAEAGVEYAKKDIQDDTVFSMTVKYRLKSQKEVYRRYLIPEKEEMVALIGKIYDNWEFREKLLPTSYIDQADLNYLYVDDYYQTSKQLSISSEETRNLFKTYKTELETMTFAQTRSNRIIGYLGVDSEVTLHPEELDYSSVYTERCMLPIYENFVKTRSLLEKAGNPISDQIPADEVLLIRVSSAEGDGQDIVIDKEEDIQKLLDHSTFLDGYYSVGNQIRYDLFMTITWKDGYLSPQTAMYLEEFDGLEALLK